MTRPEGRKSEERSGEEKNEERKRGGVVALTLKEGPSQVEVTSWQKGARAILTDRGVPVKFKGVGQSSLPFTLPPNWKYLPPSAFDAFCKNDLHTSIPPSILAGNTIQCGELPSRTHHVPLRDPSFRAADLSRYLNHICNK